MAEPLGMRPFHPAGVHPAEIPAGTEDSVCPASDVPGRRRGSEIHPWVPGMCSSSLIHPCHLRASPFRRVGSMCVSEWLLCAEPQPAFCKAGSRELLEFSKRRQDDSCFGPAGMCSFPRISLLCY